MLKQLLLTTLFLYALSGSSKKNRPDIRTSSDDEFPPTLPLCESLPEGVELYQARRSAVKTGSKKIPLPKEKQCVNILQEAFPHRRNSLQNLQNKTVFLIEDQGEVGSCMTIAEGICSPFVPTSFYETIPMWEKSTSVFLQLIHVIRKKD